MEGDKGMTIKIENQKEESDGKGNEGKQGRKGNEKMDGGKRRK